MTATIMNPIALPVLAPVLSQPLLPAAQRFNQYNAVACKRVEDNRANHIWRNN